MATILINPSLEQQDQAPSGTLYLVTDGGTNKLWVKLSGSAYGSVSHDNVQIAALPFYRSLAQRVTNLEGSTGGITNEVSSVRSDLTDAETNIVALQSATQGTADETSGVVVRAAADMSAAIEMTASNPAGKMFNHSTGNYIFEVYRAGRLIARGGIDNGQSAFFHPEVLGAITINFTQVDTWHTPTGYMIIESAGG